MTRHYVFLRIFRLIHSFLQGQCHSFLLLTYLFTSGSTSPVDGIISVDKLGDLFRDFLLEALVVRKIRLGAIGADDPKAPHVLERRVPVDLQHRGEREDFD